MLTAVKFTEKRNLLIANCIETTDSVLDNITVALNDITLYKVVLHIILNIALSEGNWEMSPAESLTQEHLPF